MSLARVMMGRGVYYGWLIVAVLFLVGFTRAGFSGFLFGVFLKPMSEELGWSRGAITGAAAASTITAGVVSVLAGRLLDRYGPRTMMVTAALVIGLCYIGLSRVTSLLLLYLAFLVGRTLSESVIHQGMVAATVSKWFVRHRPRAIAVAAMGSPVTGAIMIIVSQAVISAWGWRSGWLVVGFVALGVFVLPGLIFLRRDPEAVGLRPFGLAGPGAGGRAEPTAVQPFPHHSVDVERSWRTAEAVRTRAFWLLCVGGALGHMLIAGANYNLIPYFTDIGIGASVAVSAFSAAIIAAGAATLFSGMVAEWLGVKPALLLTVLLVGVVNILFLLTRNTPMAFLSAILFGIGQGGFNVLVYSLWAHYFGRRYLGSIQGTGMMFQQLGNGVGPLSGAIIFDLTGSYIVALQAAVGLGAAMFVLYFLTSRPVSGPVRNRQ